MLALYNQDIKFKSFKSYEKRYDFLEDGFKTIKLANLLADYLDDIQSVGLKIQHIWYEDGILSVHIADEHNILVCEAEFEFRSDVLGFYLAR